jgi:hypothetical protein
MTVEFDRRMTVEFDRRMTVEFEPEDDGGV